jgi:hypothetical protein
MAKVRSFWCPVGVGDADPLPQTIQVLSPQDDEIRAWAAGSDLPSQIAVGRYDGVVAAVWVGQGEVPGRMPQGPPRVRWDGPPPNPVLMECQLCGVERPAGYAGLGNHNGPGEAGLEPVTGDDSAGGRTDTGGRFGKEAAAVLEDPTEGTFS